MPGDLDPQFSPQTAILHLSASPVGPIVEKLDQLRVVASGIIDREHSIDIEGYVTLRRSLHLDARTAAWAVIADGVIRLMGQVPGLVHIASRLSRTDQSAMSPGATFDRPRASGSLAMSRLVLDSGASQKVEITPDTDVAAQIAPCIFCR